MSNPIDWASIKPVIVSQIQSIADLQSGEARFVDEPAGLINGLLPVVWLRVTSVMARGIEEERVQDPSPFDSTQPQSTNVCGQREFTLSVRCESVTPDVADDRAAVNLAEKIKTRVMRTSSREARGGLFGIARRLGTSFFSYIEDGRPVSCYVVDLLCTAAANDVDTESDGSFIQEALVHGDLKGTTGSTIESVDIDANAK